ncbi:OS-9-like protein [Chlorella sorokiniana]|uniref:OS-9-like protein n=1 Tax=Chlorella sorokiniana TaxID=3076 RepID=A0A2P6TT75_CHLSO|nr:OS-9-like protein [Chlorella sorokiniana]|eukprot:PRW57259.1 OS-9-like protein [Chlorella sorokiniana]
MQLFDRRADRRRRPQRPLAAALLLLLGLAARAAAQSKQVVYLSDPAVTFVDGGETAEAYVVGLSSGGQAQPPAGTHRMLDMRAANGTRYRCYIPERQGEQQEGDDGSGGGSSSVSQAAENSLFPQKSPGELLEALTGHCYYRIEEYWTFELCYQKQLRQYHKEGSTVEAEYVLGKWSGGEEAQLELDKVQIDTSDVAGATPYVAQQYTAGDSCELTGRPREAEVRFTCGTGGDTLLVSVREPSSCTYIFTIATPRLCKHPAFQQQPPPAALIQCHALPEEGGGAEAAGSGSCAADDSGAAEQGSCAADAGVPAAADAAGAAAAPAADGSQPAAPRKQAVAAASEEEDEYADVEEEAEEDEYADAEEEVEGVAASADDDPDDPYL